MTYDRNSYLQNKEAHNFRGASGRGLDFTPNLPTIPIPRFETGFVYPVPMENFRAEQLATFAIRGTSLYYVEERGTDDGRRLVRVDLNRRYKLEEVAKLNMDFRTNGEVRLHIWDDWCYILTIIPADEFGGNILDEMTDFLRVNLNSGVQEWLDEASFRQGNVPPMRAIFNYDTNSISFINRNHSLVPPISLRDFTSQGVSDVVPVVGNVPDAMDMAYTPAIVSGGVFAVIARVGGEWVWLKTAWDNIANWNVLENEEGDILGSTEPLPLPSSPHMDLSNVIPSGETEFPAVSMLETDADRGFPVLRRFRVSAPTSSTLTATGFSEEGFLDGQEAQPVEIEWIGSDVFSFFVPVVRPSAPLFPEGEPRLVRAESSDRQQGFYQVVASGEVYFVENDDGTIDIFSDESGVGSLFRVDENTGAVFVPYRLIGQLVSGSYTFVVAYSLPSGQISFRRFQALVHKEGDVFESTRQFRGSSPLTWLEALSLGLSLVSPGLSRLATAAKAFSTATRAAQKAARIDIWVASATSQGILKTSAAQAGRFSLVIRDTSKVRLATLGARSSSAVNASSEVASPLLGDNGFDLFGLNSGGNSATSLTFSSAVPVDLTGQEPELARFIMDVDLTNEGLSVDGLSEVRWAAASDQREPDYNSLFDLRQFRAGGPYDPVKGFSLYWKAGAVQMKQVGEEYWLTLEAVSQTPDNVGATNNEVITTLIVGVAVIEATAQG